MLPNSFLTITLTGISEITYNFSNFYTVRKKRTHLRWSCLNILSIQQVFFFSIIVELKDKTMATKLSMVTNGTPDPVFIILVFENYKTFSVFSVRFNLLCKYNAKIDPYFVSIRSAR